MTESQSASAATAESEACFPDLIDLVPNPAGADGTREEAMAAYLESGDASAVRGEYHLAAVQYGRSLNAAALPNQDLRPGSYLTLRELNPFADRRRNAAMYALASFFKTGGDPNRVDAEFHKADTDARAAIRDTILRMRLPHGYLVVADDTSCVLAVFPDSDGGRIGATSFADAVGRDLSRRFKYSDAWLADGEEFDTVVYHRDGQRAEEIHREPTLDEDGAPVRSADA